MEADFLMSLYIPLQEYVETTAGISLGEWAESGLGGVAVQPLSFPPMDGDDDDTDADQPLSGRVRFDTTLEVSLPSLDAVSLLLAPGDGATVVTVEVDSDPFVLRLVDVPVALRFSKSLLQPVAGNPGPGEPWEADPTAGSVEVELAQLTLEVDAEGTIDLDVDNVVDVPPVLIGQTGVGVSIDSLEPFFGSSSPSGEPDAWRGVSLGGATLHLPGELGAAVPDLSISDATIGNGGFSGTVEASWEQPVEASWNGIDLELESASITLVQNTFTACSLAGAVTIPFFDEPVDIDITIAGDGAIAIAARSDDGLYHFSKPVVDVELDALEFRLEAGTFTTVASGRIAPDVGYELPPIEVTGLEIDSDGSVSLPGGWLELGDQYSVDLAGFGFEITAFGMGTTDDGRRWIGLNGGVALLEGIPAGASVEGLRIAWDETDPSDFSVSLNGVGVEFEVPNAVRFKGEVSFADDVFRGDIDLELLALDMTIDAQLVFGEVSASDSPTGESFKFMGISLAATLPSGIPLWATGLGLYGFGGLFASNMAPDRGAEQDWFSVSRDPAESWYHEATDGVTDLEKWRPEAGAMGFGAAVDLATAPDNGLNVATDLTFVISFPGPIVILQGRAELLQPGGTVDSDAPLQTLIVLDNQAGSLTVGVDARFDYSPMLEIAAAVEAFYSFDDPTAWYLNVGEKEPRENRIRAEALSIFTAESYLMLNPDRLAMGIWTGYDESWSFGPLSVQLTSYVSSDALVNFRPAHFYGIVEYNGEAALSAFGISASASIYAGVEADAFRPFHLRGEFSVGISLPWPLSDISATVSLEWGPRPALPDPVDPVDSVGVGHELLASTWDPATEVAGPVTDASALEPPQAPLSDAPVVALDARPEVTFARPVHDESGVGGNPNPPNPAFELVGDPAANEGPVEVRYELSDLTLRAWDEGSGEWVKQEDISGTWAPLPGDSGSNPMTQTKLQLSTRTPYYYSRNAGGAWEDAIDRLYPQYPCTDQRQCYRFEGLTWKAFERERRDDGDGWAHLIRRRTHERSPWATFELADRGELTPNVSLTETDGPSGKEQALVFGDSTKDKKRRHADKDEELAYPNRVTITLPEALPSVRLRLRPGQSQTSGVVRPQSELGTDLDPEPFTLAPGQERSMVFAPSVSTIEIDFERTLAIVAVCDGTVSEGDTANGTPEEDAASAHLARWSETGAILEPYTDYLLSIETTAQTEGRGVFDDHEVTHHSVSHVAFSTEGPPGLSMPDQPTGSADDTDAGVPSGDRSELATLERYVEQTTPPTVPAWGEKPPLPRPVYRAEPFGVDFRTDYVDLLYATANRDLRLYLFDSNDRPVRDLEGQLLVSENPWGVTEDLLLSHASRRWFERIAASPCLDLTDSTVERTKRLETETDHVLEADTVYEVRLRPLLFREMWAPDGGEWQTVAHGSTGGDWHRVGHETIRGDDLTAIDEETLSFANSSFLSDLEAHLDAIIIDPDGDADSYGILEISPSSGHLVVDREDGGETLTGLTNAAFEIPERYHLEQTVEDTDGTAHLFDRNPDLPPADADQPADWTDFRATATVGTSTDEGTIGLCFRHNSQGQYRVELEAAADATGGECRLLRIENGDVTREWSAVGGYEPGVDCEVVVEAVSDRIHVLLDGQSVHHVTDPDGPAAGTVGPYTRETTGRCTGIVVDDFRTGAPTAYRFTVTTSQFVDARHHFHSFDEVLWTGTLPTSALPTPAERALPDSVSTDDEHRTYRGVLTSAVGVDGRSDRLEVTRLTDGEATTALFLNSPEPIDWATTSLTVEQASPTWHATRPDTLKLTGVDRSETQVSVLARERTALDGVTIDWQLGADSSFEPSLVEPIEYDFEDLESLAVINEQAATLEGGEELTVTSADGTDEPTVVVAEQTATAGVLSATIVPSAAQSVGLVFRQADDEYDVIRLDSAGLQFLTVADGAVTTHWEGGPTLGTDPVDLELVVDEGMITASVDSVRCFTITDPTPTRTGRVGVTIQGSGTVERLTVGTATETAAVLSDPFTDPDPGAWSFVTEPPYTIRSTDWSFTNGYLREDSNMYGFVGGPIAAPGTYATTGDTSWTDYRLTVAMRSEQEGAVGAIGAIVRYQDDDTYYRFSMDATRTYRRFIRVTNGQATLLWSDDVGFEVGRDYQLTLECVGDRLRGFLDGSLLFDVRDDAIDAGCVGLYCRANEGARFGSLEVRIPRNAWLPHHTFSADGPVQAGTRLAVVDDPSAESQPRTDVHQRADDTPSLPDVPLSLRLRTADDGEAHSRPFDLPDAYTEVDDCRVLRSADGTGFLLCHETETLPAGQYRLTFEPAGDDGPLEEPVSVDIPPWESE